MNWQVAEVEEDEVSALYPTHHCFDDMLQYIDKQLTGGADPYSLLLVHGLCLMPSGTLYAHAWAAHPFANKHGGIIVQCFVFRGDECFIQFDREVFERRFRPKEVTIYTMHDAAKHYRRTRNAGPWNDAYLPYCGNDRRCEEVHA